MYYKCSRCQLKFKQKCQIIKHYNNKKICGCKDISIPNYNNIDKMRELSLIPLYDDEEKTDFNCNKCGKSFSNDFSMKRHIKSSCKKDIIISNENITNSKLNIGDNNLIDCPININFNFNINGFDEKWSIDHINDDVLSSIIINNKMYENLFTKLMENIENINIILNDDNGFVYMKNTNKPEEKKKEKIFNDIVEKLKIQLKDIVEFKKNKDITFKHFHNSFYYIQYFYMLYKQKDLQFNTFNEAFEKIIINNNDIAKQIFETNI